MAALMNRRWAIIESEGGLVVVHQGRLIRDRQRMEEAAARVWEATQEEVDDDDDEAVG